MILFDILMRGPDSYWKRRFHAEEIRRRSAEADLTYYRDTCDSRGEELDQLAEKDIAQSHAIAGLNKEMIRLNKELDALREKLDSREREILLLHEALRSERDARAAVMAAREGRA